MNLEISMMMSKFQFDFSMVNILLVIGFKLIYLLKKVVLIRWCKKAHGIDIRAATGIYAFFFFFDVLVLWSL